jgi:TPR repeat protein
MGLLYSTGQGGAPLDYVSAHMLFNLAAMRGSVEAKLYRRELSREMDNEEVAEAQRAARRWLGEG